MSYVMERSKKHRMQSNPGQARNSNNRKYRWIDWTTRRKPFDNFRHPGNTTEFLQSNYLLNHCENAESSWYQIVDGREATWSCSLSLGVRLYYHNNRQTCRQCLGLSSSSCISRSNFLLSNVSYGCHQTIFQPLFVNFPMVVNIPAHCALELDHTQLCCNDLTWVCVKLHRRFSLPIVIPFQLP